MKRTSRPDRPSPTPTKAEPRAHQRSISCRPEAQERLRVIASTYRGIGIADAIELVLDNWDETARDKRDALALRPKDTVGAAG